MDFSFDLRSFYEDHGSAVRITIALLQIAILLWLLDPWTWYLSKHYVNEFYKAAKNGKVEAVKSHLIWGIDPDVRHSDRRHTPLMIAAAKGHLEVVNILLKHGADPNLWNSNRATALYAAALNDHLAVVDRLIKVGARADFRMRWEKIGQSPLYQGFLWHVSDSVVKRLVEAGANPDLRDAGGNNWVAEAADAGDTVRLKMLLELGADPNDTIVNRDCPSCYSYLMEAAYWGRLGAVCVLLSNGANPLIRNSADSKASEVARFQLSHYERYKKNITWNNQMGEKMDKYYEDKEFKKMEPKPRKDFRKVIRVLRRSEEVFQDLNADRQERMAAIYKKIKSLCPKNSLMGEEGF